MIIQNLYHANLKIDSAGVVSLESAWQLARTESAEKLETFLEEARIWGGNIGDAFRVPTADGSFESSETVIVTEISIKPVDLSGCQVIFTGMELGGEDTPMPLAVGAVVDLRDSDGVLHRKRKFRAPIDFSESPLPSPGELLDWENGAFCCESCTRTLQEAYQEFEITAREISLLQLGLPTPGIDDDGFATASVAWFVDAVQYQTFIAQHSLGGAESWAGEHALLVERKSKPIGRLGYEVTLLARQAETKRISQIRTEEFAGFSLSRGILREIIWRSHWRVLPDDLPDFFHLTGTAPADWAEANCLITKVTPTRISDFEYDVVMEAQHSGNPGLFPLYSREDNSDLDTRTDVSVDMVEFHITAEMAGYQQLPSGKYQRIPNWSASYHCPFQQDSYLPESMIERTVRCLVVTISIYQSGKTASQIDDLSNWTESRIFLGNIAGISGSFLKIAQRSREVHDDSGRIYTRVSRSYQKSPRGFVWNSNYWNNN